MNDTDDAGGTSETDRSSRLRDGRPVVVGIDGSSEAARGLIFAADLAERIVTDLIVVHAYGLVGAVGEWRDGVDDQHRRIDEAMENEWCAPLADRHSLRWEARCVSGSAVDGVLRTADQVEASFIVVGSHGAGNSTAPLLGSTSHKIVGNSRIPVVVVPPSDNHRHRRPGIGSPLSAASGD